MAVVNKTDNHYIQIGSFTHKSNAYRLKETTQLKTHQLVTVKHIKKHYVVKVGPMHTTAEVNATREELISSSINKPVSVQTPTQELTLHENNISLPTGKSFIAGFVGIQRPNTDSYFTVDNGSGYDYPYNLDHYSRTIHTSANAAVEAGYRWMRNQQFIPAYSLSARYQHTFDNDIGNQITQYSMSDFTNYIYQWNIASDIFLLIAKVNLVEWHHIMPYVSAGAGVSVNRTTNYNETALPDVTPRTSPNYMSTSLSRFAYHVGAGVDLQMSPRLIASLDYEYQNLGKIRSGDGVDSWAGTNLSSSRYHTNTVMLGLNYLFDFT